MLILLIKNKRKIIKFLMSKKRFFLIYSMSFFHYILFTAIQNYSYIVRDIASGYYYDLIYETGRQHPIWELFRIHDVFMAFLGMFVFSFILYLEFDVEEKPKEKFLTYVLLIFIAVTVGNIIHFFICCFYAVPFNTVKLF